MAKILCIGWDCSLTDSNTHKKLAGLEENIQLGSVNSADDSDSITGASLVEALEPPRLIPDADHVA